MPNNGRYTICPYYRCERGKMIFCEDCQRRFKTIAEKEKHLDKYCDSSFNECKYAQRLNELWEEIEKKPVKGSLIFAEHQVHEYRKELQRITRQLDDIEKRFKKSWEG